MGFLAISVLLEFETVRIDALNACRRLKYGIGGSGEFLNERKC